MSNKITKKELNSVFIRNLLGFQWGWNYEKMQGLGYCFTILPALKKIYKDDPEKLKKSMKTHLSYFNTTPAMSHLIVGANIAMEEEIGIDEAEDAIVGLKTGMMGPFAGVGDTIFITIYRAIVFSIAAYLALEGQGVGLLIPLVCGAGIVLVRYRFTMMGYTQGRKLAAGVAGQMKDITEAASVLGLMVIGAMVPSVVNATLPITFTFGEVSLSLQEMLNKIMPGLLPLAVVFFSYWLLGKKGMNSTRLIFVLIVLGIVMGNLGPMLGFLGGVFF